MSETEAAGFAVLSGVLAAAEAGAIVAYLSATTLRRTRAGARNLLADPLVSDLARDARLVAIASAELGSGAFPFKATLFDKSPGANWLVAWHQDTALPMRARRDVPGWGPWSVKGGVLHALAPAKALRGIVALRVHLDDSSSANGPLRVLPGTHRMGVLDDARIEQVASTIGPVECVARKGGVVLMRPLLVHASSKATAVSPRRVLHFEYATSSDLDDGLELNAGPFAR
jgi:ectoine hydroxylase-related dioxygenase (phytanoyl-CoA dioxygenase family)